jgi:tetratricopeptide (TPR) repeat protein
MVDIIIDFLLKVYRAVGLQGLGIGLVIVIAAVWVSTFLRRKLRPFRRAEIFFQAGNLKKAFSFLLLELEKNPKNKQALLMRADIHNERREYRDAELWYYRLIDLKKPGDGIDVFEIKKRLLKPLYHQQRLLDLFNLSRDLLRLEKNCPPALYYLGLLYMGQLYYREAKTILERLVSVRPGMHEALFASAVALLQLNETEAALFSLRRAIEVEREVLYDLVLSFAHYQMENYSESRNVLAAMSPQISKFDTERQYLFALRLSAFCNMKLGVWDDAVKLFGELYEIIGERKKGRMPRGISKEEITLYNEFGRKREEKKKQEKPQDSKEGSVAGEYYRLKEFLIEERKDSSVEGLSSETWAAVDLGLAMVKAGRLDKAIEFFDDLKNSHPEVIGLKRFTDLIRKQKSTGGEKQAGDQDERGKSKTGSKRVGLADYLEVWESGGMRPYGLLLIAEFSTKKQLSPLIMFTRSGKFSLDF